MVNSWKHDNVLGEAYLNGISCGACSLGFGKDLFDYTSGGRILDVSATNWNRI